MAAAVHGLVECWVAAAVHGLVECWVAAAVHGLVECWVAAAAGRVVVGMVAVGMVVVGRMALGRLAVGTSFLDWVAVNFEELMYPLIRQKHAHHLSHLTHETHEFLVPLCFLLLSLLFQLHPPRLYINICLSRFQLCTEHLFHYY